MPEFKAVMQTPDEWIVTDSDGNVERLTEQEFRDAFRIVGHDNHLEVEER